MPSEYRQLGMPRYQPQQQIGGGSIPAPRDLGAEQFMKAFAGLSSSLASYGQQMTQEHITKSLAEGAAWRKQSQKSFREAVNAGEIHPTQNPHFAVGALKVDGEMAARAMTSQWLSEWQVEVSDRDSTLARNQGGFEVFMQDKVQVYEDEEPFVSHYQANSFYDITQRVISGNTVKQNAEALERDLYYTNESHVANITHILYGEGPLSAAKHAEQQVVAQEAYDALWRSGALTSQLKSMLLEDAYTRAMGVMDEDPRAYVERITSLKQNGGTLGDTKEGREAFKKYRPKIDQYSAQWGSKEMATLEREGSVSLGVFEHHTKHIANDIMRLEELTETGGNHGAFVVDAMQKYADAISWVGLRHGLKRKEYEKAKEHY